MSRKSKINYFKSKKGYYTTIKGIRYSLAKGPEDIKTFKQAENMFKKLQNISDNITDSNYQDESGIAVIYVIQLHPNENEKVIKFGTSTNISDRLKTFRSVCSYAKLLAAFVIPNNRRFQLESSLFWFAA